MSANTSSEGTVAIEPRYGRPKVILKVTWRSAPTRHYGAGWGTSRKPEASSNLLNDGSD
jgi:hypothetical protein